MRVLVAPDKYKGCLTAAEVAAALGRGLAAAGVDSSQLPLADGGDGSVDAALTAGYAAVPVTVIAADGRPVGTRFAMSGPRAVVEVANTCGLAALAGQLRPMTASSLGFGQAVVAALDAGADEVVVALGGSASTDGGTGLLVALGARLLDADGQQLPPAGSSLGSIATVDRSRMRDLRGIRLVVATDVDNPLLGPRGAAAVFAPQKGASAQQVEELAAGLARLAELLDGTGLVDQPGTGAAGGLGFACAWLGAERVQGADYFLDLVGFDSALQGCAAVVTGEGASDAQTLSGKLPARVAARCRDLPVHLVVGASELTPDQADRLGVDSVTALVDLTDGDPYRDPALSQRLLEQVGERLGRTLRPE